ncbi:FecR family protein [uncultured Bacteroides sp.]|uniref:FecR family protein n=1 Tax=uncultured Bacteroides sp. TaxID=162156 RepID=UPI00260D4A72|nr:FecR family protein [uncultured Bacteroides sp.]
MDNKRDILKHLLSGNLSEEEKAGLNESLEFKQILSKQWNNTDYELDDISKQRIWKGISKKINSSVNTTMILYYKWYSIAVSVLLLIAFGGLAMLWNQKSSVQMYVVASGIQNLEKIKLPDGTQVCLGPGSRLEYPSEFRTDSRDIKLEGQAYFDVAKNPDKPFIVHTGGMQVEALGTAFELFNYDDCNEMEAVLVNGSIKVDFGKKYKSASRIMKPDEKLTLNKLTGKAIINKINADKYTSWRSGVLSFENENLAMIIPRLEKWYGRNIECDSRLLNDYRFTFKVRDESLEVLLFIMRHSAPIMYTKDSDNNYTLTLKNK